MKKNLVAKNELGIYADADGVVRADSLVVAQIFEKRHDNVVRDIRNLDCSEEFRLLNFEESSYINLQGHRQACFNMTRDGFVFLVMGYRGKKAASFKEAYIKRFNEMEEFIKYLLEARTEFPLLTENIMLLHESPKPSKIMKQYLLEGRLFKEIADDEGRTYEAIKKRMERIRAEIREEILECLEMNCRGGE